MLIFSFRGKIPIYEFSVVVEK